MKKWKEILSDKGAYPDDFVVTLKDGQTMSLGDMRAYDTEHEGELTQRLTAKEQEIQKREQNVNTASIELAKVIEKTAEKAGLSVEEFLGGKAPVKKAAIAEAGDLDENDPLVGKLVKQIKGMQATIEKQATDIGALRKDALGPMLNTYLEDYYESRWDKLAPTLPEGSDVSREKAMDYATKHGYKDAKGRLDLDKAAKDLTFDVRVKAEAKKLAETERKKADDEKVLASVPRPSSLGQKTKTAKALQNEKGQTKTFDEVLNDALTDTDMWRGIQNVN